MIRYALRCANNHSFESWFQSAEAYDKLHAARMITCTECGSSDVSKELMAPRLAGKERAAAPPAPPKLDAPATASEQAVAELRRKIEQNSDYVGHDFATEARRIHEGTAPERAIHGEANLKDARKLVDDGIPVAPLPFIPSRKTN